MTLKGYWSVSKGAQKGCHFPGRLKTHDSRKGWAVPLNCEDSDSTEASLGVFLVKASSCEATQKKRAKKARCPCEQPT